MPKILFQPGISGNPKGRPKGRQNLKTLIQKVWDEEITDAQGNKTVAGLLAVKAMFDKACSGDVGAFKELCNRLEGMPEIRSKLEGDITHRGFFQNIIEKADSINDRVSQYN